MNDESYAGRQLEQFIRAGRAQRACPTVLLVDPNPDGVRPFAAALNRVCDVAVIRTAREAFATIALRIPDLVVTELDLPDASGIELIARIHAASATCHVLLLVMTARRSVRDKIAAFQAGADDYLVKPVDPREFVEHVGLLSRFRRTIGRV
jgi:DNA-binding response OmpR family regulator